MATTETPQAGGLTLWVKRTDVLNARYTASLQVGAASTVDEFIARWVAELHLDCHPSLVSLRLVKCGARKPSSEEEKQAVELDDPRLSLAEAGITDGCSLLAFIASSLGTVLPVDAPGELDWLTRLSWCLPQRLLRYSSSVSRVAPRSRFALFSLTQSLL